MWGYGQTQKGMVAPKMGPHISSIHKIIIGYIHKRGRETDVNNKIHNIGVSFV